MILNNKNVLKSDLWSLKVSLYATILEMVLIYKDSMLFSIFYINYKDIEINYMHFYYCLLQVPLVVYVAYREMSFKRRTYAVEFLP